MPVRKQILPRQEGSEYVLLVPEPFIQCFLLFHMCKRSKDVSSK
jgi:hypothetical protein